MKLFSNKFFIVFLVIAVFVAFLFPQTAEAKAVVNIIEAVVEIVVVVAAVAVIAVIGIAAGALIAQVGLALAPAIFTTIAGTAIVTSVIVGAGLLAADCLFEGGLFGVNTDPNLICKPKESSDVAGSSLLVDVKVNGSDGPLTFLAPANFNVQWAISGADQSTSCTATGAWSGNIADAGGQSQMSGVIAGSHSYGIECVKPGVETSDSVIVNVFGPPTVKLSGNSPIEIPNPIQLSWANTYTDYNEASGNWSGRKKPNSYGYGLNSTSQRGNYSFTLTAFGPAGQASDTINIQVIQVPRCSFSANPTSIILPQTSTLSWSCSYADICSINQGVGSVNPISGTQEVRPSATTTYTLSCDGLDGARNWQSTVNVGFTPRVREVPPW